MAESAALVHPSAYVDEGAQVGPGSRIWHFTHVMSGAVIGRGCVLGQNVFVASTARIGDGCKIQNNVSVYDGVVLEDDVFVGPSAVFTNVLTPRAFVERKREYLPTRVGRGASIGANATILCGCTIGPYALVGAGAVVTHDVAPYARTVGVPARAHGWVCHCGVPLAEAAFVCGSCGRAYRLDSTPDGPRLFAESAPR